MINVLINGANGKMGRALAGLIGQSADMRVAASREEGQAVEGDFDLVIDFSLPEGAAQAYELAKKHKAAFLTGTTNLPQSFLDAITEEEDIPVFYSPNVSIGVFLFTRLAQEADALFAGYGKAMHEAHHAQKKDAPSGTAKSLAAALNFAPQDITYERIGAVPGTHSVTFTSPQNDEEIILTHKVLDRKMLAASALRVAGWLVKQKGGFYNMADFVKSIV
ncbi:MAG: hypothetical protein LBR90_04115 [Elusimicrobiota bacterium]|jgi:4-hydroxy-tetrahydrodipicolinate reductase|nr:hypothetical protein [Elusimicrobiota bacterium]